MITKKKIDNWFTYHPPVVVVEDPENPGDTKTVPDRDKIARHHAVREAGKLLANVIFDNTLICPDQSHAIRKVREAVMMANAAIACGGK